MKKLHPLLSVLFLIYWGCDITNPPTKEELIGIFDDIEILEYKFKERSFGNSYSVDILYSGVMIEDSVRTFVKNLHELFDELNSYIWLTEQSYVDNNNQVYNGSISRGLLIVGKKSKFRGMNNFGWSQEIGDFESLFGLKENL